MQVIARLKYTKKQQIGVGQGLNSEVFIVNEPQLGGEIVIKEIPKANFPKGTVLFFNEAQSMYASSHQNVVPIFYACENDQSVCLAMPYFSSGSLQDRIKNGPLNQKLAIKIGLEILNGLQAIHIKNLIHLDLKPSNVLFDNHGRVLVADFGQTRQIVAHGLAPRPPMYLRAIPPELISLPLASIMVDIYQFGLTMYRVVNGEQHYASQIPADDDVQKLILAGKFPRRDWFLPHVSKSMRMMITKCLNVNPVARFQSAFEISQRLSKIEIRHDWKVHVGPQGTMTWESKRLDGHILTARLNRSAGGLTVEFHSRSKSGKPRRLKNFCSEKLSAKFAQSFLKECFQTLESQ